MILEEENRRHSEIWIAPADGIASPRRLTTPAFSATSPGWSPDGRFLFFTSDRPLPASDDDVDVWFLDMSGGAGEAFQIEGVGGRPIFSHDSSWIAFAKATPPTGSAARRARSAGSPFDRTEEFERLVEERFTGRIFDWMGYRFDGRGYLPDPRSRLETPPRELWVVPTTGGVPRQLTRLGFDVGDATWDPSRPRLVFTADEHQRDEYTYERDDLWSIDLEGVIERLTDDGYVYSAPTFSPDGGRLAYRRSQGLDMVVAAGEGRGSPIDVLVTPASGGEARNVTEAWDLRPESPTWSADGGRLLFTAATSGETQLFAAAVDGSGVRQLTEGRHQLGGVSLDGATARIAYVRNTASTVPEIHVARTDGSAQVKVSRFNDVVMSDLVLASTRPIRYPSRDGTQIHGWVMTPPGYRAGTGPYPMILAIHGGPHGAYGERFSFQFQLWAAEGYVVVFTNPRGSTGYGEDFLWATWGGWGNLDFDDVMGGVDYAVENFEIDPARLGVAGYSYGGFLTNWVITHTDRFAAAVSGAGISNWLSDYATSDIPRTKESEFYGPPWETRSAALLWEQSPVKHAAGVSTPTLFVHGEDDFRVPIEQAEQMYLALRKQRVPARFIRYPETSHGGWRPWDTVHRYLHELQWWREHLDAGSTTERRQR